MAHRPDSLVVRSRVDFKTGLQKDVFISALEKLLNVAVACKVVGLNRQTVYAWRKEDKNFAERWENALEVAKGSLESSIYLKLAQVLTDDRKRIAMPEAKLAELLLAGAFPEKYRQRGIEIDNSTNVSNLTIDWSQVPDDIFNAFQAGKLTLEDVYQQTILLQQKTPSTSEGA